MTKPSLWAHILEYCRDEFKPITPLVGKVAPRTTLYRFKDQLLQKGLLETDRKDRYKTTLAGFLELQALRGTNYPTLSELYSPLERVPTPQHRALIELGFAAVVARKYELRVDRHPTLVLAGPTLTWKTSCAMFLCYMVGLDPLRQIVNLAAESGKSLWLRKTSTGQVTYKRELLNTELVVFDEFQAADPQTKRLLSIFMDGRKTINFENEQLTIHPVPLLTINPKQASTLEARLDLSAPQIRRSLICDLARIKVPDLVLKGEEILQTVKAYGGLALKKPKADCAEYKANAYSLFKACLNQQGVELVDFEMLLLLSSAMTSYLEPVQAIRLIFHDAFVIFETLDWTLPGWPLHVSNFPIGLGNTTPAIEPAGAKVIPKETWIAAFNHLDAGGSTSGLVTTLHLGVDVAETIARQHAVMRALDEKRPRLVGADDAEVQQLERDLKMAELKRRKAEQEKPLELEKKLADLQATVDAVGRWKQEHCSRIENNYCMWWSWDEKPSVPYQISEPLQKNSRWHIHPTYARCAACPTYHKQGTTTLQSLELKLSELEAGLDGTLFDIRRRFKCSSCGSTRLVAMKIQCTECGSESWWGYYPH